MKPKKKSNSVNNLVDKLIHPKRELMIWEVTLQKLPKIQHREIKQGRKYERLRHVRQTEKVQHSSDMILRKIIKKIKKTILK